VETTFSKGMMRITTTAVGGGLAAIVMNWSVLASNPYYLSLFILPFDFVVGLGMFTQACCLPSLLAQSGICLHPSSHWLISNGLRV